MAVFGKGSAELARAFHDLVNEDNASRDLGPSLQTDRRAGFPMFLRWRDADVICSPVLARAFGYVIAVRHDTSSTLVGGYLSSASFVKAVPTLRGSRDGRLASPVYNAYPKILDRWYLPRTRSRVSYFYVP